MKHTQDDTDRMGPMLSSQLESSSLTRTPALSRGSQPLSPLSLLERLHAMQAAILMQAQEHAAAVQAAAYVALEAPQA